MCMSRIETQDADSMVQYAAPIWIDKKDTPKPRLVSQLTGGFNFGGCRQAKEVRNDPHTPYLFHGEEYSRASRLWTAGLCRRRTSRTTGTRSGRWSGSATGASAA
jgi:hypothetical protein